MKPMMRRFLYLFSGEVFVFAANIIIYFLSIKFLSSSGIAAYTVAQSLYLWLTPVVLLSLGSFGSHVLAGAADIRGTAQALTRIRLSAAVTIGLAAVSFASLFNTLLSIQTAVLVFAAIMFRSLERDHITIASGDAKAYLSFRVASAVLNCVLVVLLVLGLGWHAVNTFLMALVGATAIASLVQSNLLGLRWLGGPIKGHVKPKEILMKGGSATLATFFMMGGYNIDLFMLVHFDTIPVEKIGLYAATSKAIQFAVMPMSVAILSLCPRISVEVKKGNFRTAHRIFIWLAAITVSIGLTGAVLFSRFGLYLMSRVSGKDFTVLGRLDLAFSAMYFLIGLGTPSIAILPFLGKTTAYLVIYAALFSTVCVAQWLLIPKYGAMGAIGSVDIGLLLIAFLGSIWSLRWFKRRQTGSLIARQAIDTAVG